MDLIDYIRKQAELESGSRYLEERFGPVQDPVAIVRMHKAAAADPELLKIAAWLSDGSDSLEAYGALGGQYKAAAVLTQPSREKIKKKHFAIPKGGPGGTGRYPIHDESHARNALTRVRQYGTPSEKSQVYAAVAKKYPGLAARSSVESVKGKIKKADWLPGTQTVDVRGGLPDPAKLQRMNLPEEISFGQGQQAAPARKPGVPHPSQHPSARAARQRMANSAAARGAAIPAAAPPAPSALPPMANKPPVELAPGKPGVAAGKYAPTKTPVSKGWLSKVPGGGKGLALAGGAAALGVLGSKMLSGNSPQQQQQMYW